MERSLTVQYNEGVIVVQHQINFSAISVRKSYIGWNEDNHFILDQHTWNFIVLFLWNNNLQVDKLLHSRHMILIPSRPVFDLAPLYRVLSGEAANTNLIALGLTRPGFKSTIYSTNRCDFCTICMFSCILLIPWCSQTLQQSCFYCTNGPVFIFIMILITVQNFPTPNTVRLSWVFPIINFRQAPISTRPQHNTKIQK